MVQQPQNRGMAKFAVGYCCWKMIIAIQGRLPWELEHH